MKIIELLKHWWTISTGFRHGVTTWLGAQLAVPLAQTAAWADSCAQNSCNVSLLPNWHSVLLTLGYASLAAIISALLKVWQQKRAFPSQ
jgi:hypothetical protein